MPRKGENIYKRKDGRWEGRYIRSRTENGKAIYGYVYARTYRETKDRLLNTAKTSISTEVKVDHPAVPLTFGAYATQWLQSITPQIKESTQVRYHNLLKNYILPTLGTQSLFKITPQYLESYCGVLLAEGGAKGKGLSTKTVADVMSVVRNVLKYSIKNGAHPPCDGKTVCVKQKMKNMRIFSRNEQNRLCQYLYAETDVKNIGILICLFTGLRVGELCALRWEDISIGEKTIYVHQTMQRIQSEAEAGKKTKVVVTEPKSRCSVRKIPIPYQLATMIAQIQTSSYGYFLTGEDDKYIEPRTMQNHFKRVLRKCAIAPANFHALRHTFATRCVELGFDVKSLSEILGHASVNITMNRYVHPSMELKEKNMERLAPLFAVS